MTPLMTLLVLACSSADATSSDAHGAEKLAPPADGVRVELAVVDRSEAHLELTLPGEIEGSSDAVLGAALGGYVEKVSVSAGDRVRRGQSIARIDAELHGASLTQAEAQHELAASELARIEGIGDHASASQLQAARTNAKVAEAAVRQARARLARALVTAPFAGTVAQVGIAQGEVVNPGSPIARLVAIDPVSINLSVSDRDIVNLHEGMAATVSTNARADQFKGVVSHVGPAGDLKTRTFLAEVEVANPDGLLLPGMIARVSLARSLADSAVVIPQDVLVTTLDDQGVFVAEDDHAVWRSLDLGEVVGDQVVVEGGLALGEHLVVVGQRDLFDGDPLIVAREGVCCTGGRVIYGSAR